MAKLTQQQKDYVKSLPFFSSHRRRMEKEKLKYEKSLAKITFVKQAYEIEAMQQVIIAMRSIVGTKFDDKCKAAYAALDTARHELLEATHIDG